jgi:Flp pilus assembly protein TadD
MLGLVVAFCCPLVIYAATACRTVYWGDTGEFLVAAVRLGIPHSPGTPLYPLLGRCFAVFSPGNPALSVNLLSSFFSALSGALIYATVVALSRLLRTQNVYASVGGALTGSLVWSATNSLWSYSTVAEVYTLQMAFVCGLVYLGIRVQYDDRGAWSLVAAFFILCGLSLANNITVLLLIPGLLVLVLPAFAKLGARLKAASGALLIFGITLYLYMPVRSLHDPPIDWGNPETLNQFFWVLSAREFARNMFGLEYAITGGFGSGLITYARLVSNDISLVGIILSLVGMAVCYRLSRRVFASFLVLYATTLIYSFAFGADLELEAYLLPSLMITVLFLGTGVIWICGPGRGLLRRVGPVLFLVLPAVLFATHYAERDLRSNRYAERIGRDLLSSMDQNALLFTDNTVDLFVALYVQSLFEHRQDVSLIYLPYLKYEWYRQQIQQELDMDLSADKREWLDLMTKTSSYYTPLSKSTLPAAFLLPDGIRFRVAVDTLSDETVLESARRMADSDFDFKTEDYDTRRHFAIIHSYMGEYFFLRERYPAAAGEFEAAARIMPENCEIRLNLASAQEKAGRLKEAFESYRVGARFCRDRVKALKGLGRTSLRIRDFTGAREYLEIAASLDESDASVQYNLGLAQLGLGDPKGAEEAYLKAIQLRPHFPEALTNLGISYLRMNRRADAVTQFRRAIAADSSYVEAYLNLSSLYVSLGSISQAEQVLRAGLKNCRQSPQYHLLTLKLRELVKVSK